MKKSIFLLFIFLIFINCSKVIERSKNYFFFGNVNVSIILYGERDFDFDRVFKNVEDTLKKLDNFFSKYNQNSYVYKFNLSESFIEKNDQFLKLIFLSDSLKKLTDGYFNIFIEPLLSYYSRCEKEDREPETDSLKFFVKLINDSNQFTVKDDKIYKKSRYVAVDFGGIAKGYFGDIVVELLKKEGVKKGLVNLGGDIVCFNLIDKKPFRVGIRSFEKDSVVKVEEILNGSIVTSGDYFRYYEINGKRYCHIIDPKNGESSSLTHSVTVIAPNGTTADALATALMILKDEKREEILKKFEGVKIYIQN